jgi:SAM-dependent methyltransferase
MRDAEFNDPRLVEVYDAESPWTRDDDYFVALVNETPGVRVLDLGCGTGRIALGLADAGHTVTGIDPSLAALAAARAKPGAKRVAWIHGTAESAPDASFDIVLMTGHVSQFLLENEWAGALGAIRHALVPGGRLAFHAYDPRERIWERWTPEDTRRFIAMPGGTTVLTWTEVTDVSNDEVSFSHHYQWFPGGERLRSDSTLRFWSEQRLRQSVTDAGFTIERVDGGWRGEPVGLGNGELIVVARR